MKSIDVVIGVMIWNKQILLSKRQRNQTFANKWEFPGGKLELGETLNQALIREFSEEIGLKTDLWQPFLCIPWRYFLEGGSPLNLKLHAFTLMLSSPKSFDKKGAEGQLLKWQSIHTLNAEHFPEANAVLIKALQAKF